MASSSRLKPGEKGRVSVSVDLRGKSGNISKTIQVYANDPKRPVTTLSVTMLVKDRIHMKKFAAKEIFNGQCRGCHVDKGRGMKGFELFSADCMMCHNTGKSAMPIEAMRKRPKAYIAGVILNGVDGTSMPGWDMKSGGPLSAEEIASLLNLIKPDE